MKFRYTKTRRGYPAIRVGGGRFGGKIFGRWVIGKEGKLKMAVGRTNIVPLEKGDLIFEARLDEAPKRIVPLYVQTVREFVRGWIKGPDTQGWYTPDLIPYRVMNGLWGDKSRENDLLFADENPAAVLKYTATSKKYKDRVTKKENLSGRKNA